MKVKYKGPSGSGVVLPLPDGREIDVEHGGLTPELPEPFAVSLLEQESNWEPGDAAARKAKEQADKQPETADAPDAPADEEG